MRSPTVLDSLELTGRAATPVRAVGGVPVLLHRDVVVPTEGKLFRVFFACLMVTGKLSM